VSAEEGIRTWVLVVVAFLLSLYVNELARVWKQNCMSCFEFSFFLLPFFLLAFVVKCVCEHSLTLVSGFGVSCYHIVVA
jgi:hypothetical protein